MTIGWKVNHRSRGYNTDTLFTLNRLAINMEEVSFNVRLLERHCCCVIRHEDANLIVCHYQRVTCNHEAANRNC